MKPLVKKEIRLLLPAWIVAVLLALVQAITRPYDFYVVALLFVGMTMMALTTFGREASLNTFSSLLAQPAERMRIWRTKLSVLAVVFLITFGVWFLAFGFAFLNSTMSANAVENSFKLFIAVCLIATATFTGGLWTTLLLRQMAAAFWLTLLVPATLSGFTAAFVSPTQPDSGVIAVLCVIFAIYSIGGFFFARWLFFRAQDTGWSGGIIALPRWKFTRSAAAAETRTQKPIFALLKKELQLQQAALAGAAGLFLLHLGILALRAFHKFPRNSAGEILTSVFWMLWLVLPAVVGCTAIAEERKLGVIEGQLCLPASRRVQFTLKVFLTLCLGVLLGGVVPVLLEAIGSVMHASNPSLITANHGIAFHDFLAGATAFSAWLVLVGLFASSLAKSFLQAVGFAILTFIAFALCVPVFANGRVLFFDSLPAHSFLPLVIAVPTFITTLPWLAYLNFKNFRDGWPLWRPNILGFVGTLLFVFVSSAAIYHRVWEIVESVEPPHGLARLSASEPPKLSFDDYTISALLPDGRLWTEQIVRNGRSRLAPYLSTQRFIGGSNWVDAASDPFRIVAIQSNGTLWSVQKSLGYAGAPATAPTRIGSATDWSHVAGGVYNFGFLLIKTDGTLWFWGVNGQDLHQDRLETYLAIPPKHIGNGTNWTEVFGRGFFGRRAQKSDGSVWFVSFEPLKTNGVPQLSKEPNIEWFKYVSKSRFLNTWAGVKNNGELWLTLEQQNQEPRELQLGVNAKWKAVAFSADGLMITLRNDGTLWQWPALGKLVRHPDLAKPTQLGTYSGWIALHSTGEWPAGSIALATDGGLWVWRDPSEHTWLAPSRKPEFLGNVFGNGDQKKTERSHP